MKQQDLVIKNVPVVINTSEQGMWTEDFLVFLKPDVTEKEIRWIINYLYDEGFILDRRIQHQVQ